MNDFGCNFSNIDRYPPERLKNIIEIRCDTKDKSDSIKFLIEDYYRLFHLSFNQNLGYKSSFISNIDFCMQFSHR